MRNRSVTYSPEATFGALADPTRRAVLDLLRRGRQPAGQIANQFPVSRPAISKHLRLLRRAHLVEEQREGRHRYYQLNPAPLRAAPCFLSNSSIASSPDGYAARGSAPAAMSISKSAG